MRSHVMCAGWAGNAQLGFTIVCRVLCECRPSEDILSRVQMPIEECKVDELAERRVRRKAALHDDLKTHKPNWAIQERRFIQSRW